MGYEMLHDTVKKHDPWSPIDCEAFDLLVF